MDDFAPMKNCPGGVRYVNVFQTTEAGSDALDNGLLSLPMQIAGCKIFSLIIKFIILCAPFISCSISFQNYNCDHHNT